MNVAEATNGDTPELIEHINQTTEQAGKLQQTLDRTMQVLSKRGIQIQIDFNGMAQLLMHDLEKSHKSALKMQKQLTQMQELVHTSALITSSLEFDQVLEEVLDTVIKLTGAERAYLMLTQGENRDLRVHVARNNRAENLAKDAITFSHQMIHEAIEQRSPIVSTNAQEDDRFTEMKSVFLNELRSIVIIPLILKDKVVGALYADNRVEQGVFSQENIPLLSAFANQAAIAISNARLFEKVQDELKEAQRQVQALLVEIDQSRVQEKVKEITESEYFQDLSSKVKDLRRRSRSD
ncbi:MAG: GAF domain-containing protein [Anaerolineae bacterium]|uniref:GAF domain-containing protein n=1 Tax=Candidatus Flexifilum breve TaxID=3140694 RepID=UPI001AD06088|nr:GAF domain-containing protein [Chloroflexota bacterium]MBK9747840.1 GAF domain-containing protein [Chloroflexota bacterium]MBN8634799.1 GAF domain-containing protein [Anaerolineae bacterium]